MKAKAPSRKAAKPAKNIAEWTIMVYMAGDNNLDDFGEKDIFEMKAVGSSDKIHILVQRDTAAAGVPTLRYRARKGTELHEDVVDTLGETNTGDPKVLADFLAWGMKEYPAKRTMAVLWNHGNGWDDTDIYAEAKRRKLSPPEARPAGASGARRSGLPGRGMLPPAFVKRSVVQKRFRGSFFISTEGFIKDKRRAIGFDDDAQDFLDNVEMKKVFDAAAKKAGKKFDIIGMDACLMSMIETAVQVAQSADVLCASQEIEPGAGWPYDRVLKALAAKPEMDGATLAAEIAQQFHKSYPKSEPVTQAVTDLAKIAPLQQAADALGSALAKALKKGNLALVGAITNARARSQGYEHPDYVDLIDFATNLGSMWPEGAAVIAKVKSTLAAAVLRNCATNAKVARSNGLSIYLPAGKRSPLYSTLEFAKTKGGWAQFLATLLP